MRSESPINKKEKPKMNSPMDLRLLLPENSKGTPTANKGNDMAAISTLKPKAEIIHAVTVVPIWVLLR